MCSDVAVNIYILNLLYNFKVTKFNWNYEKIKWFREQNNLIKD